MSLSQDFTNEATSKEGIELDKSQHNCNNNDIGDSYHSTTNSKIYAWKE